MNRHQDDTNPVTMGPDVPTLERLAAEPGLGATLPRAVAVDLHTRCLIVLASLTPALAKTHDATPTEDRVLSVADAAAILGISDSKLIHERKTTYRSLVITQGRCLGFSALKIQAFIRRKTGQS